MGNCQSVDKVRQPQPDPAPPQRDATPPLTVDNVLFNVVYAAKQWKKESEKLRQESRQQHLQCVRALGAGDRIGATVAAELEVSKKMEADSLRLLSGLMEIVADRLKAAKRQNRLVEHLDALNGALTGQLDLEKMNDVLSSFERQFEDEEVQAIGLHAAMQQVTLAVVADDEVQRVLDMAADEVFMGAVGAAPPQEPPVAIVVPQQPEGVVAQRLMENEAVP